VERAVTEQRDGRVGNAASSRERRAKRVELRDRREIAVPQQPGGFFECGVFGQLVDLKSGDHELAAFTVNVAQARRRRHDSFQSAARHMVNVAPVYDCVNVDS
jgi:hypothetical protein